MKLGFKKKIKVTAKDIAKGIPDDVEHCPIAHALRRELKLDNEECVEVEGSHISIPGFELETPAKAAKFIDKFDDTLDGGKRPKPFEFTLDF